MSHARLPLRRNASHALALVLILAVAACGGGGGPGAPGSGGGGGDDTPPTLQIFAPLTGVMAIAGDTVTFSFVAADDRSAVVTILADADLDPGTTGDQTPLFVGTDQGGAQQEVPVTIVGALTPGDYALLLRASDGVNPAFELMLPRNLVVYPGIAGVATPRSNRYGIAGGTVVFSRGEAEDGAGALNGDGDTFDGVLTTLDPSTGLLTQPVPSVSMDVTSLAGGQVRPVPSSDGVFSWLTLEADEGRNLNGLNNQNPVPPIGGADTDQADAMVSYLAPILPPAPVTNTYGGATGIVARVDGRIVVHYQEAGEGTVPGGGSDLNFDADALDAMFGYVDSSAPGPTYEFNQILFFNAPPAAAAGTRFESAGLGHAGLLISEAGSALGTDFNADGDPGDSFLWLGDLAQAGGTGLPANFAGLAGVQPPPVPALAAAPSPVDPTAAFALAPDGRAAYYIDEAAHNVAPGLGAGNDRNGDVVIGFVPTLYHVPTMTEVIPVGIAGPLNSGPGAATMIYEEPRAFFTAMEFPRLDPVAGLPVPGTNADGDNGADLAILYWTDHSLAVPVATPLAVNFGGAVTLQALSLDNGGSVTTLAPGWLAIIVNEAANGAQDINASGAVDMAWLLVDTAANPAPTVYNPRLVPSAAGTIPLAGLTTESQASTTLGVVLRLTEAANGDLDGDANPTETFFAFLSFAAPTQLVLLDAGGDHAALADGRIGVTANEAFTGQDYDGNGRFNDTVFRVFDFAGAVLEKGRLCSPFSVPVTESGMTWVYLRDEAVEGRRLNADADMIDLILGLWVP